MPSAAYSKTSSPACPAQIIAPARTTAAPCFESGHHALVVGQCPSAGCETDVMDVRQVDPRDIGWEVDSPSYRVYFWERRPAPAVPSVSSWHADEFEITDVEDVTEVLAWAQETANPRRTYTVYVVVEGRGERGLARLAGADPTRPSDST
jgi:hypothetical protein